MEKVFKWSKDTCVKSDVVMKDVRMELLVVRKEPKSAREYQRLLRTQFVNWNIQMPQKMVGWLRLIAEGEYEAMRRPPGRKASDDISEEDVATSEEEEKSGGEEKSERAAPTKQCYPSIDTSRVKPIGPCLRLPENLLTRAVVAH